MGFGAAQGPGINPLKQYDLSSDPDSVVNVGQAYWKDTGSGNEFFLEDETGNVTQVTTAGTPGLYNVFPASLYVTGGKLGLGTQTPSSTFEIEGSSGDLILEIDNNAVNSANFQIQNGAGNARADLVLDSNTHITMKGQRVGIVQTNPQYTLDVNGDGRFTSDVTLSQIVAPGTTTDKLYNVGGSLTWNGTNLLDNRAQIGYTKSGALEVDTNVCFPFRPSGSFTVTEVYVECKSAPTGSTLIIDVNKNGTTIFTDQSNRPTIAISGTTATSGTPDVTSFAKDDAITIDIDQIGSGDSGEDLTIQVRGITR